MVAAHLASLRPSVDPRYRAFVERFPEPAGELLGSGTAAAIVALLALHPAEAFPLGDLELRTGASYESVHRTVRRLERAGVVVVDRSDRRHTVTMHRTPTTAALRALTLELGPLGSRLRWCRSILGPASVEEAFVFGSIAAGTEHTRSDIDLFVVGDVTEGALLRHLGGLADQLARDINPVCRTRDLLDRGLAEGRSFLTTAVSGPRLDVARRADVALPAA